jgi:protein-S-isoprenylcysteine O-methyltransferase Ste14
VQILINQNVRFYMSNTRINGKRLGRWFGFSLALTALVFGLSGRWTDPWLWAYVSVFSAAGLYAALRLDDDLARERFRPPEAGADRTALKIIRLVALSHVVVGLLDAGRWHITRVPDGLRLAGLAGMIFGVALVFHAMTTNRFFSAVVRIQRDRGHHVVDRGPYALVRHPGYVGMITGIPFGALVLGSWLGVALALVYAALMLRRVIVEDAFLRTNLAGYDGYASRVRYRLVPGVW